MQHFEDTVLSPVSIDEHEDALGSDGAALREAAPGGYVALWGIVPNRKVAQYERVEVGDRALFVGAGRAFYAGTVIRTFHNSALAKTLWGRDDEGRTWEYMYALSDEHPIDIPRHLERRSRIRPPRRGNGLHCHPRRPSPTRPRATRRHGGRRPRRATPDKPHQNLTLGTNAAIPHRSGGSRCGHRRVRQARWPTVPREIRLRRQHNVQARPQRTRVRLEGDRGRRARLPAGGQPGTRHPATRRPTRRRGAPPSTRLHRHQHTRRHPRKAGRPRHDSPGHAGVGPDRFPSVPAKIRGSSVHEILRCRGRSHLRREGACPGRISDREPQTSTARCQRLPR